MAEVIYLEISEKTEVAKKTGIAAIHAPNATYTIVVFRMAMQCCFSLLMQLTDLK